LNQTIIRNNTIISTHNDVWNITRIFRICTILLPTEIRKIRNKKRVNNILLTIKKYNKQCALKCVRSVSIAYCFIQLHKPHFNRVQITAASKNNYYSLASKLTALTAFI